MSRGNKCCARKVDKSLKATPDKRLGVQTRRDRWRHQSSGQLLLRTLHLSQDRAPELRVRIPEQHKHRKVSRRVQTAGSVDILRVYLLTDRDTTKNSAYVNLCLKHNRARCRWSLQRVRQLEGSCHLLQELCKNATRVSSHCTPYDDTGKLR